MMISSIVMVTPIQITKQTALTPPPVALISMIISTPMVLVYQVALTQEEMSGIMAHISAILLVLLAILKLKKMPVWTHANLNLFDSMMRFSIVTATLILITAQTAPTQPLDVLLSMISSILMVHACQAAHILIEMSGTMVPTSVILLAPMDIGVL
jgi:hypothetical protein